MADPGFPKGGANLLFGIILAENCTKTKKIGHGEGLMHAPRPTTSYILFKILAWGVPATFMYSIYSVSSLEALHYLNEKQMIVLY